jgi:DNA-binding MurR/RpiR family transcriptional regulator
MNERNFARIPHNCVLNLQAVYDTLKSAERKAADYMLDFPEDITGLSIVDFAGRADCSEATIVRLSKRLGYEGYPELKRDFTAALKSDAVYEYDDVSPTDPPGTIIHKVFEASIRALNDSLEMLDEEAYTRAAGLLAGAGSILFAGIGDAAPVAQEAQQRFMRIGINSRFSLDYDLQLINASQLNRGDVVIAISHSGRSKPVVEVCKLARERGALILGITNFPVSPLAKKSDVILQTAVFAKSMTGEVISKRITALCVIESLYLSVLFRKGGDALAVLGRSNDSVNVNKF